MLVKSAFERLSLERKKKLIDTAMDLYFEMPFEEITIRILVDRLGINMNTFYRYFETKDDLFLSDCRQTWCWVLCPAPFFF